MSRGVALDWHQQLIKRVHAARSSVRCSGGPEAEKASEADILKPGSIDQLG